MARRMYDLDNGTEEIKVKSIKTNSVFSTEDSPIINYNKSEDIIIIGRDDVLSNIALYARNQIDFVTDQYGSFYINDEGFVFNVPTGVKLDTAPLYFGFYTTALRPSVGEGAVIYDITLKKCILYNGTAWVNLDGTALS